MAIHVEQQAQSVISFWFEELKPRQWWIKDFALDREIDRRFGDIHSRAISSTLSPWRKDASGRLAEIIVLDQFSRNIYRGTPRAFAADSLALGLAEEMVSLGLDGELETQQRAFVYMPYMHSESPSVHIVAVKLFKSLGLAPSFEYELRHKAIIDRFGRYPHRNQIIGRKSTVAERAFLLMPGSSF